MLLQLQNVQLQVPNLHLHPNQHLLPSLHQHLLRSLFLHVNHLHQEAKKKATTTQFQTIHSQSRGQLQLLAQHLPEQQHP